MSSPTEKEYAALTAVEAVYLMSLDLRQILEFSNMSPAAIQDMYLNRAAHNLQANGELTFMKKMRG